MQRLKRKPLLMQLASTLRNLTGSASKLLPPLVRWPTWLTTLALIVCFLLALSLASGCSPRIVRPPLPPQAEARVIPTFDGKTWRDVLYYVVELRQTCQASEADKSAIRYLYTAPVR